MRRTSLAVLATSVALVGALGSPAFAAKTPPPADNSDWCSWTHHNHYTVEHRQGCNQDPGYWYQHGGHHGSGGSSGGGGHR